jgi:predicted nucleotidyltransferase component of viral defense system
MDQNNQFFKQAQLLVRLLPYVEKHDSFALKGGTGINFFIRNMPRLSVDIDLVFVPVMDRERSLGKISTELCQLAEECKGVLQDCSIITAVLPNSDYVFKLVVQQNNVVVKLEVSPVGRGVVFDCCKQTICEAGEKAFGFASMHIVSFEDMYAGKLCAALDRQHPRDLFDVKVLFENEGITRDLFRAFLVYLISCNRPIAELLKPNYLDLRQPFTTDFVGMSLREISINELDETREVLISKIHAMLTAEDKEFLISFKKGNPEWDLLAIDRAKDLPAIKWKLYNLDRMKPSARQKAVDKLESILYG